MPISRRRLAPLLAVCLVLVLIGVASRKYIWLYATRKADPGPPVANLLDGPVAAKNPEALLTEANRLAWVFNWPKAEPLYVRAEQLFRERSDTRNEVYARVGRIRAQAEASSSWVEVSEMLGQQLEVPAAKSDPKLRLWCLAAKGYTDREIDLSLVRSYRDSR
jgi:hypothetical protein